MKPGRVVALVAGCVLAAVGIALFIGSGALTWAYTTQRDDDGYFTSRRVLVETLTPALHSERVDLGSDERPDQWPFGKGDLATVKLEARAEAGDEVFIGRCDGRAKACVRRGLGHQGADPFRALARGTGRYPGGVRRDLKKMAASSPGACSTPSG